MNVKITFKLPNEVIEELKTECDAKSNEDIRKTFEVLFRSEFIKKAGVKNMDKIIKVEVEE